MLDQITKALISNPTSIPVHPQDKIEMALDVADAAFGCLTGDKTLDEAGMQAFNASCRLVDRTLDRTLDAAEDFISTGFDILDSLKFW